MADENDLPCRWCGDKHGRLCPFVKALEFDGDQKVTRVEFLTPADFGSNRHELEDTREPDDDDPYPRLGPKRN